MILWVAAVILGGVLGLCARMAPGQARPFPEIRLLWLVLVLGVVAGVAPHLPAGWGRYLFWVQQGAMTIPLVANLRLPAVRLLAAGAVLNGIAIAVNGGRMPVQASSRLLSELPFTHGPFSGTWLDWLGDWISIPVPLLPPPNRVVASPGDIVIVAALAWLTREVVVWLRSDIARGAAGAPTYARGR